MNNPFEGVIPASSLDATLRDLARRAGWRPAEDHEDRQRQKADAGTSSATRRRGLADLRRSLLQVAREGLTPDHRREPYGAGALEARRDEFQRIVDLAEEAFTHLPLGQQRLLEAAAHAPLRSAQRRLHSKALDALCRGFNDTLARHGVRRSQVYELVPLILAAATREQRERLRRASLETIRKDVERLRRTLG